jgi:hypothetical protein
MFALCSTSKVGIAEALTDCTGDVPKRLTAPVL